MSISTLLYVVILRGALLQDKEHQWEYIYPVACVNTAEELFYTTRNTSGSIPTLLCFLIQQRSSSTRQGAPVGVYRPVGRGNTAEELFFTIRSTSRSIPTCCVCKYCRGALLYDKEHR